MFPSVNTKDPAAVAAHVERTFATLYPTASVSFIRTVFRDMETLFSGRHPNYNAVDLKYHDFEHTLQATLCMAEMLKGRHLAEVEPRFGHRAFELSIAGVLLHDTGYIKLRSDTQGTGAKYTFSHVLRSCAYAASYLPTLGANDHEVEAVLGAISCTGPNKDMTQLQFREPTERIMGCALATADFLGQLAAEDYPEELEILFYEFQESDNFIHLPPERRLFKSAEDLIARTPGFWRKFVQPKLESDFQAVYRFLAEPYPHGRNRYLEAVEKNICEIERRNAAPAKKPKAKLRPARA
jgi:hypothetical protein